VLRADLAVISSIALEHTQWLGDTVELIAREKAGILKAGRPALIGPSVPAEVVRAVAEEVGAGPVEQLQGAFDDYDAENSALAARALHLLAEQSPRGRALLAASPAGGLREELVQRGVRARPPCRFQQVRWDPVGQRGLYRDQDVAIDPETEEADELQLRAQMDEMAAAPAGVAAPPFASASAPVAPAMDDAELRALRPVEVVLDVCHNPAAFEKLFEKLRREYDPTAPAAAAASPTATGTAAVAACPASAPRPPLDIRAVVGFSSDKDFVSCLHMLMRHCRQVCLVQGDTPRAATAAHVLEVAREHSQLDTTTVASGRGRVCTRSVKRCSAVLSASSVADCISALHCRSFRTLSLLLQSCPSCTHRAS
jgi:folylpolyglutamate synthase/dihydropteroate synthase